MTREDFEKAKLDVVAKDDKTYADFYADLAVGKRVKPLSNEQSIVLKMLRDNMAMVSSFNKAVPGKMKDVAADEGYGIMTEFVGLRSKMYSFMTMLPNKKGRCQKAAAKGVKKSAAAWQRHERYKDCLLGMDKISAERRNYYEARGEDAARQTISFIVFRSYEHQIFTEIVTKVSLCAADNKFYQVDANTSYAYGHKNIACSNTR
jgi:hypothetical protein